MASPITTQTVSSGEVTIITNHRWHNLLYGYELTNKERGEFTGRFTESIGLDPFGNEIESDNINSESFIRYHHRVYHLNDFTTTSLPHTPSWLREWDGYINDSFFSGVVIKIDRDNSDQYMIGTYIS